MRLLDLTLPTPEENLALDEALFRALDRAVESGADPREWEALRFWECPRAVVVLGRSGRAEEQVDLAACGEAGIPVRRRSSGGGAVLLGPGCLCFSLALSYRRHPALREVAASYRLVLGRIAAGLAVEGLAVRGTADLALGDRKVSGNAQLRGRHGLLHQDTLLHAFEPALLPRLLREPRGPDGAFDTSLHGADRPLPFNRPRRRPPAAGRTRRGPGAASPRPGRASPSR
ncbi:MAG TPA: lipoate--protein ligase family protein [Vicinamibacteria bacterium]|nr:lipoate--protein ligase family protein [Vicinamibacteria bacterium]